MYVHPLVHTPLPVIQPNVNTGAAGQRVFICHQPDVSWFEISKLLSMALITESLGSSMEAICIIRGIDLRKHSTDDFEDRGDLLAKYSDALRAETGCQPIANNHTKKD